MFGRSNNVTFSTRKTASFGKRLHLHRHLPNPSTGTGTSATLAGCRSPTSKLCELRKSNSFSDNFTARHNVAIATQVISPSAIGQSNWLHGGRGTRLITSGFGRRVPDEDDDDDQNSLIIGGRRRRWCTWSKLGCVATTIGASVLVMTIIILAVGYMQSEKERVFSKPVRFVQREGKGLVHRYRSFLHELEPRPSASSISPNAVSPIIADTGQKPEPEPAHEGEAGFRVTTYHPTRPDNEFGSASATTAATATSGKSVSNSRDRETAASPEENSDFLNEISDFAQRDYNDKGLHQQQHHEHKQVIVGEQEQFQYSDSPPSEVKVLPPKDFVFNPSASSGSPASSSLEEQYNAADIVQHLNNAYGNNGLSFTIPIYTASNVDDGAGAGAAASASDIARDMLNSFTSSTPKVPSSSSAKSTLSDDLILLHSVVIDGTTKAPAAASTSKTTEPSPPLPSSTEAPLPPTSASADYANPFNYEPAPVQNLNKKVEHSNDVPVVAKLQTDLFDDEDEDYENQVNFDNEREREHGAWSHRHPQEHGQHGYGQRQGPEMSVTVRDNIYVHDPLQGGVSNAGTHERNKSNGSPASFVYGRKMKADNNAHQHRNLQPPRIRIHDRMYTPKPGSVVIIEPVEYPPEQNTHVRPPSEEQRAHHINGHGSVNHDDAYTKAPAREPEFHSTPTPRPRPFPVKTTSTSSSFSKLYEFHDENGGNDQAHDARPKINSKVEYIQVDKNPTNSFMPSTLPPPSSSSPDFGMHHNHKYHDYSHLLEPTSTTTIAPAIQIQPYMVHFPMHSQSDVSPRMNSDSNTYYSAAPPAPTPPTHIHTHVEDAGNHKPYKNPLLSPEVSRFLSNLNVQANNHVQANAILAPLGMGVSFAPGSNPTSPTSNYGVATNSHLAELSNFDNFDFSQFLTKTPDPTAANNYGGATTPAVDVHLTKRTFHTSGLDSAAATTATNPYAFLYASPTTTSVLGSPTPAGAYAGLTLPLSQNPNKLNTNYLLEGGKLLSGSIPLDLASSYISSVPIASATAYGAPQGTPSVSLINYNDPTLALANFYSPAGSASTSVPQQGNYNTITQGIHLLSLLSGNIPQHLLHDQHLSASTVTETRTRAPHESRNEPAQARGIDPDSSGSSSLLASLIPDQIGSFSQNIVTRLNAIRKQAMKNATASIKSTATAAAKKSANTDTLDILGIRATGSDAALADELHSTLVKKDGAKNYGSESVSSNSTMKKVGTGLKSGFYT